MSRPRKGDLTEFQNWLVEVHRINDLTAYGYCSLVRGALDSSALTQESLLLYVSTVSTKTASMFRTAWRWFVEFAATKQIALPNPFGPRRRAGGMQGGNDYIQRLSDFGYAPGSALGSVAVTAAGPAIATAPVPAQSVAAVQSSIPEHVLTPLKKWAVYNKLKADVLVRMKWEWTRFVDETNYWVTAHPAIKYSWVITPSELLDTLGEWGFGVVRPEEGPLIPKCPHSTEPFPKLALRLLIEDGT